jgi:solute carrier family 25 (mitochondrial 2-oxodicarboxylate transporter), member 21
MNSDNLDSLFIIQVVKSRIQGAEKLPGVTPKYNWTYPAYAFLCDQSLGIVVISFVDNVDL